MSLKIRNAITSGARILDLAGVPNAILDARVLLQYALGYTLELLLIKQDLLLSQDEFARFNKLIARRADFEPVAYIIGKKEFFGLEFYVNTDVLIPRSDSEALVEAVVNNHTKITNLEILDLGTGSGALIIALLANLPTSKAFAVDISLQALEVARINSNNHGVTKCLELLYGNCFGNDFIANFTTINTKQFDIIISNPPYISKHEQHLMNKETEHEPKIALFAQNQGLACYYSIAQNAAKYLKPNGAIYLEIGFRQQTQVESIFKANGFAVEQIYYDIANQARCIMFKIKNF